ncbi:MAG: DNA-processing protein DprA [bacterium]|nr:DNA-processing protein DprA [bacterium]
MPNQIDERTIKTVALCRFADVTPRLFEALLHHFGNLERIVRADSGSLMAIDKIGVEAANKVSQVSQYFEDAELFLRTMEQKGISVTTRFDDEYPKSLFEINDPPPLLYVRGKLPVDNKKSVALVGADQPTNEGIELTTTAADHFVRASVQVISSLYRGIDAAAHLGCIAAEATSFAVPETGLEEVRADAVVPLAIDIVKEGGLITDFSPETEFAEGNYKQANRLLVGMSQAVVVTELYSHSARTLDLLEFCHQTGMLTFLLIDPAKAALSDESALNSAVKCGALPMLGLDKLDDIVKSLV